MAHVIWEGPSLIDGEPISLMLTGLDRPSANRKTGPMLQTWILRSGISPLDAIKLGQDYSICGDCKHRGDGTKGRTCYVNVGQGPTAAWRGNHRYEWPDLTGHRIRLGAYGDPAAMPTYVIEEVISRAQGWTGYTHLWRTCDPKLTRYLMASVDSEHEARMARAMGWKTFRVKGEGQLTNYGEITCPASEEMGFRTTCFRCGMCDGRKTDIAITVHGTGKKHFKLGIL